MTAKRWVKMEGEPKGIAVDQGTLNGWRLSWNPDDERYYVDKDDQWYSFREWRNATRYARTH